MAGPSEHGMTLALSVIEMFREFLFYIAKHNVIRFDKETAI